MQRIGAINLLKVHPITEVYIEEAYTCIRVSIGFCCWYDTFISKIYRSEFVVLLSGLCSSWEIRLHITFNNILIMKVLLNL